MIPEERVMNNLNELKLEVKLPCGISIYKEFRDAHDINYLVKGGKIFAYAYSEAFGEGGSCIEWVSLKDSNNE